MDDSLQVGGPLQPSRVVVRIWDLDETLIVFQSLLMGTFIDKLKASGVTVSPRPTAGKEYATALGRLSPALGIWREGAVRFQRRWFASSCASILTSQEAHV